MDEIDDPQWIRVLVFCLGAGVAAWGAVGLFFAVIGRYGPVQVFLFGALAFAGLCRLARPLLPQRGIVSPEARACAFLALAAVLAITFWNAGNTSQHVFIDRDGAVYLNAGRWIADHGNLEVDISEGPFATSATVTSSSPGMSNQGDHLDFTLSHLLPALLAEANSVGGDGLMFATLPILGGISLLAFYLLARRFLGNPFGALGAMLCLAFVMPQVLFSRDSTTEIALQTLLFTGVWLLCDSRTLRHAGAAFTAGVFLGLLQAIHIDGLVFLIGLPFICAFTWLRVKGPDRALVARGIAACAGGAALGVALGFFDLLTRSSAYLRVLDNNLEPLAGAVVLAIGAAFLVARLSHGGFVGGTSIAAREGMRTSTGFFAAEVVLILGFGAWLVRPYVQTVRGPANEVVQGIQQLARLEVDPTRRYWEHSMDWVSWYVGPLTLVLAILGTAYAARALARGSLPFRTQVVALVLAPPALLYLFRPSITPDQIWAARRFVPAVLPAVVLAAFGLICVLARRDDSEWSRAKRDVAIVLGLATVAFPLYTLLNIPGMTHQRQYAALVKRTCGVVGHTSAVIMPQETGEKRTWLYGPQTLRTFCDVPVGVMFSGNISPLTNLPTKGRLDAEVMRRLAYRWAVRGRKLYIVTDRPKTIQRLFPEARITVIGPVINPNLLEKTLTRRPTEYAGERITLAVAEVPLPQ